VFHAGDGNLHPLICYDEHSGPVGQGGRGRGGDPPTVSTPAALTGEHGIGADKACSMPAMFTRRTIWR
jgi:glycolate oxidase